MGTICGEHLRTLWQWRISLAFWLKSSRDYLAHPLSLANSIAGHNLGCAKAGWELETSLVWCADNLIVQDVKNGRTEGWSQRKQNGRDPRNGLTQGLHIRNRMHLFLMFPYTVSWRWWIRDTWIMGSRSWHVGNHRTSTWHPLILFYWNWLPFAPRHVSFSDAHDKKAQIIPDSL
jgi:hypothetical protein